MEKRTQIYIKEQCKQFFQVSLLVLAMIFGAFLTMNDTSSNMAQQGQPSQDAETPHSTLAQH